MGIRAEGRTGRSARVQQFVDQRVKFGEVGRTHIPFDNFSLLVNQESGWRELNVAPSLGNCAGVVDGDFEWQLTGLCKVHHITRWVVAHGDGQGIKSAACEFLVCGDQLGHFCHAGRATGGPKINQNDFSLQLRSLDCGAVEQDIR